MASPYVLPHGAGGGNGFVHGLPHDGGLEEAAFDAVSYIPSYADFAADGSVCAPYGLAGLRPEEMPAAAAPAIDVRHFKTRLCVYLSSGSCPHGARCFFAHSVRHTPRSPCTHDGRRPTHPP